MSQPFNAVVIEVALADVPPRSLRQGRGVNLELVVLRGHIHRPELGVAHRVVAAVMTKTETRRGRTRGLSEDLVAEADAEQRDAPVEQVAAQLDRMRQT
jgi:hypothetical protein